MRILHLTTFLQGGAGLAIATLARLQRAVGHDVVVVTSKTAPDGYGNYPAHVEALELAGVPAYVVDSLFYRDRASNLNVVRFLRNDLQAATRFDIIHTHAAVPSRIALRLAGRDGPAVIQTMHGWGVRKTAEQQEADLAVLNRVPRVVVPSRASFDLLARLGVPRRRMRIVPYGVDPLAGRLASGDSADADLELIRRTRAAGRRVVCAVGTIGERKNQRLLVEALALMPDALRPLCIFVGEGDVEDLHTLADYLGLTAVVRCTGYKTNARELQRAADCTVLASRSEGLPLTVLEAFCDRVPVIVSDIPELTEIVRDNESGLLFASGDPGSLAAALDRLFSLSEADRQALCSRAQHVHAERFTTSHMLASYMKEYAEVQAAGSRRARPRRAA